MSQPLRKNELALRNGGAESADSNHSTLRLLANSNAVVAPGSSTAPDVRETPTEQINRLHRQVLSVQARIKVCGMMLIATVKLLGEALLRQKDNLQHGEFGKWIEANCEFSTRTAGNYMDVAKNWSVVERYLAETSNQQPVADFQLRVVLRHLQEHRGQQGSRRPRRSNATPRARLSRRSGSATPEEAPVEVGPPARGEHADRPRAAGRLTTGVDGEELMLSDSDDDFWRRVRSSPLWSQLADPTKFEREAENWWRFRDLRASARELDTESCADREDGSVHPARPAPYSQVVARFIGARAPWEWTVCCACHGGREGVLNQHCCSWCDGRGCTVSYPMTPPPVSEGVAP